MKARIAKTLAATKFADAPMVGVAARPGGGVLDAAKSENKAEGVSSVTEGTPAEAEDGEDESAVALSSRKGDTAPEGITELL